MMLTPRTMRMQNALLFSVLGDPFQHKEIQNELQTARYNLGDREHGNNMPRTIHQTVD